MQNHNGHCPNPPLPINVLELFDNTLSLLVEAKKAEIIHDGSKKYIPFVGTINQQIDGIESKKYKKSYLVFVGDYKVIIKLIFDRRDNMGFIRVTERGYQLLESAGILPKFNNVENKISENVEAA